MKIVLASTSPYRKALLEKLQIPFETASPDIDESPLENESTVALVERLSIAKAKKIADDYSDALIIGSDQVAVTDNQILGKPGNFEIASKQLKSLSGKTVIFYTGLCLLNAKNGNIQSDVVPFEVKFRSLKDSWISQYLKKDQPYNSAGSFKSEGLGIALFEELRGNDPNTLVGLPLIRLIDMLAKEGFEVLD